MISAVVSQCIRTTCSLQLMAMISELHSGFENMKNIVEKLTEISDKAADSRETLVCVIWCVFISTYKCIHHKAPGYLTGYCTAISESDVAS